MVVAAGAVVVVFVVVLLVSSSAAESYDSEATVDVVDVGETEEAFPVVVCCCLPLPPPLFASMHNFCFLLCFVRALQFSIRSQRLRTES